MNAALCLRLRHTLNTVNSGFIFQDTVNAIARDAKNYFLISSGSSLGEPVNFGFPSFLLKIFTVHAEKVASKNAGLIASCSSPDLHNCIFLVFRIDRNK